MTYLEYINEWLKYKESEYSYSTLRTYRALIKKHFIPFFRDTKVEDLTRLQLQHFINTLKTSQKVCIALLKRTLKELYYDELTTKDFSTQLRKPPKAHVTRSKQALTREQVAQLFEYLKPNYWHYFIRLLFNSGLRIDRDTIELLFHQWSAVGFPKNSYVAQSKRCSDQPVSRVAIKNIFKKATEALGLPFLLTPHHARLNYTSHSLASGVSEKNLQAQLGHSSTNLIRSVYGKAIGNRLEELIEHKSIYYFR